MKSDLFLTGNYMIELTNENKWRVGFALGLKSQKKSILC